MKWKRLLSILLCLIIVTACSLRARADFGDFAGDSDYGGGDWSSGNDWDWDDDDNDYDGYVVHGGGGSSGSSSGFGGFGGMTVAVIVTVVILLVVFKPGKKTGGYKPVMPGAQATAQSQLRPICEYASLDARFDQGDLIQRLSNWYVQMQNCWSDGDIEPVRPFFSNAYWEQMNRQLQAMRKQGRVDHTERIAVLGVALRGFYQAGGEDHMIAELRTRIVSYVTDQNGTVVSGSKTTEKFMTYEWDLMRPSGTATEAAAELKTINCPNCGAAVSINESAKCPYCDSVITVAQHDWVIASIKGISQRSN